MGKTGIEAHEEFLARLRAKNRGARLLLSANSLEGAFRRRGGSGCAITRGRPLPLSSLQQTSRTIDAHKPELVVLDSGSAAVSGLAERLRDLPQVIVLSESEPVEQLVHKLTRRGLALHQQAELLDL